MAGRTLSSRLSRVARSSIPTILACRRFSGQ
jgi:hypothetical protein